MLGAAVMIGLRGEQDASAANLRPASVIQKSDHGFDQAPSLELIQVALNRGIPFATGANREVFRMNSDGSSQTDLTNNSSEDYAPDWSADSPPLRSSRTG